jgi:uncharacterized membrane protein YeiH
MASLEEILAAKAAQHTEDSAGILNAAITTGAGGGALAGMLMGQPVHMAGNTINAGKDFLAARQGLSAAKQPLRRLMPGARMAGGLVGMIVGGGLGAGIAARARRENPAAEILGKVVAGGDLTVSDKIALENMAADYYKGA